jgi:hypothetical protein
VAASGWLAGLLGADERDERDERDEGGSSRVEAVVSTSRAAVDGGSSNFLRPSLEKSLLEDSESNLKHVAIVLESLVVIAVWLMSHSRMVSTCL